MGGEYGEEIQVGELGGLDERAVEVLRGGVGRVICTGVGGGPEKVEHHLVDERGSRCPNEEEQLPSKKGYETQPGDQVCCMNVDKSYRHLLA